MPFRALVRPGTKKSGPIAGATLKRQGREGKSGKAMLTSPQSRAGMEMSR